MLLLLRWGAEDYPPSSRTGRTLVELGFTALRAIRLEGIPYAIVEVDRNKLQSIHISAKV